jgi:hypothetical protein
MVSSLLNPHCARRPTPAAVASAAGHNPETGGAPSFNNCRRARFARRAALGDAQGMSLGPGAANNSGVVAGSPLMAPANADTNAAIIILKRGLDKSLKPAEGHRSQRPDDAGSIRRAA